VAEFDLGIADGRPVVDIALAPLDVDEVDSLVGMIIEVDDECSAASLESHELSRLMYVHFVFLFSLWRCQDLHILQVSKEGSLTNTFSPPHPVIRRPLATRTLWFSI